MALYFLYEQVGIACMGGVMVIILAIPMTGKISAYLKKLQKELSKVRDERVKLSCEVIAGMKVIKFQAWEGEFNNRVAEVRDRELATFWTYTLAQAFSGAVYTAVPIFVGICTFVIYVGMGNKLHVSTALTSLALFEILRFPLYMLPNVINNLVEAKVSVERVESYLIEPEKINNPELPLSKKGISMKKATLAYDGNGRTVDGQCVYVKPPKKTIGNRIQTLLLRVPVLGRLFPDITTNAVSQLSKTTKIYLNDSEYETLLLKAQLDEANRIIDDITIAGDAVSVRQGLLDRLQSQNNLSAIYSESDSTMNPMFSGTDIKENVEDDHITITLGINGAPDVTKAKNVNNLLALSRVDLVAGGGDLIAIVGQVNLDIDLFFLRDTL